MEPTSSSNASDNGSTELPLFPLCVKIPMVCFFLLLGIASVMANSRALFVLCCRNNRRHDLRTASTLTTTSGTSLAVSDLLNTLTIIPVEVVTIIYEYEWILGATLCRAVPFLQTTAVFSSSITLCCFAVDRYLGVVHPLRKPRSVPPVMVVCVVWLMALTYSFPMLFVFKQVPLPLVFETDNGTHISYENVNASACQNTFQNINRRLYNLFLFVLLFVPLLIIMVTLYTFIAHYLYIRVPVGTQNPVSKVQTLNIQRKKRTVKTLVALMLVFFVCRVPIHVFLFLGEYIDIKNTTSNRILKEIFVMLGITNSVLNPFLYSFVHDKMKIFLLDPIKRSFCFRRRIQYPIITVSNLTPQRTQQVNLASVRFSVDDRKRAKR